MEDERDLLGEGSKPEVYTDVHEKLLGNTERSWTLFVDGIGQDGKRIYDPVKGKTCHQCRSCFVFHRNPPKCLEIIKIIPFLHRAYTFSSNGLA